MVIEMAVSYGLAIFVFIRLFGWPRGFFLFALAAVAATMLAVLSAAFTAAALTDGSATQDILYARLAISAYGLAMVTMLFAVPVVYAYVEARDKAKALVVALLTAGLMFASPSLPMRLVNGLVLWRSVLAPDDLKQGINTPIGTYFDGLYIAKTTAPDAACAGAMRVVLADLGIADQAARGMLFGRNAPFSTSVSVYFTSELIGTLEPDILRDAIGECRPFVYAVRRPELSLLTDLYRHFVQSILLSMLGAALVILLRRTGVIGRRVAADRE